MNFISKKISNIIFIFETKKVLSTFIGLLGAVGGGIVMNTALFATQPWITQELVPKIT